MNQIISNSEFYNEIASDFDYMISFDSAVESKRKLLEKFIDEKTKLAADIGCGSGVDSIALSKLGLNVVAFDPSDEMLKIASVNSERMKVKIKFKNYEADKIPKDFNNKFDLVVSLGNTFANISEDKLSASLQRCYDILKPNSSLLIQVLNYDKILKQKERIINITECLNKIFIRFYDFEEGETIFNILSFSKVDFSKRKLTSTKIYPHSQKDFKTTLNNCGFGNTNFFGDLQLSKYIPTQSSNLVISAKKY